MSKIGRPSKRTPEVEARILDGLSAGITLTKLCEPDDMPTPQTVCRWKREDEAFRSAYARAREDGADRMVDKIIETTERLLSARTMVDVQAIKEYREGLKWAAGKFNAQYGDKVHTEHSGEVKVVEQRMVLDQPPPGWKAGPDGG